MTAVTNPSQTSKAGLIPTWHQEILPQRRRTWWSTNSCDGRLASNCETIIPNLRSRFCCRTDLFEKDKRLRDKDRCSKAKAKARRNQTDGKEMQRLCRCLEKCFFFDVLQRQSILMRRWRDTAEKIGFRAVLATPPPRAGNRRNHFLFLNLEWRWSLVLERID